MNMQQQMKALGDRKDPSASSNGNEICTCIDEMICITIESAVKSKKFKKDCNEIEIRTSNR